MKANDIRKKFLEFFKSQGHTVVASDSVVPKEDPTVLFTTAGMQQFKRQFLGYIDEYSRASSSQKCLRTDDLERVGKTAYHHTFFEMLGNFSFGDYFKKEAIQWAWEFLTKSLKIPAEKLWVSIYKDDDEAEKIWLEDIKLPKQKLVKLGDKSNFWPSNAKADGPNGPCGPCSEIFFDYGVNPSCTKGDKCDPDCDCGRFSEIWNLVFTQFNRKDGGVLEPLPAKNIDTGMGLERLVAVVQGKSSNYETDLFTPILGAITRDIEKDGIKISLDKKYVIADHIRAIVFAINDGVIPSNKERGFVVKNLINNATNVVLSHGGKSASVYKLVPVVVDLMKEPYPELKNNADNVARLIEKTEEAFIKVRRERIPELLAEIKKNKDAQKRGALYFRYRDTYGLPLDAIIATTQEAGISDKDLEKDLSVYHRLMDEQKKRSRQSSKMQGDVFADTGLDLDVPKTEFTGYSEHEGSGKILRLFKDNEQTQEISQGDVALIILDRTPFYAESGGQIGDTGSLSHSHAKIRISDTQKKGDVFIHYGEVEEGTIKVGDTLFAKIDSERRWAIMRNHTATHLLQTALRTVLGTHVQQQGSLVAQDRLRFDFTHPQAIKNDQIRAIEDYINEKILANEAVEKEVMPLEDARKSGALAFFAEKYGKTVRVVAINGYSKEFCGGTHLETTGQIGLFKIANEGAIAQGIRRIEAKTGTGALEEIFVQEQTLSRIADIVKAPKDEIIARIEQQAKRLKNLEKELGQYRFEVIKGSIDTYLKEAEPIGKSKLVLQILENADIATLRKVLDLIKQKEQSAVAVLGSHMDDNAYILVGVTDDLVKKGVKAHLIVGELAPIINGSGGGRPQMAQAGSKDPGKLKDALQKTKIINLIKETLKT